MSNSIIFSGGEMEPDSDGASTGWSFQQNVKGKTIQERREEARRKIAIMLLQAMSILVFLSLVVGAVLLYLLSEERFDSRDMLNLVLAIGSIFSGLLGSAITFYFSSQAE